MAGGDWAMSGRWRLKEERPLLLPGAGRADNRGGPGPSGSERRAARPGPAWPGPEHGEPAAEREPPPQRWAPGGEGLCGSGREAGAQSRSPGCACRPGAPACCWRAGGDRKRREAEHWLRLMVLFCKEKNKTNNNEK